MVAYLQHDCFTQITVSLTHAAAADCRGHWTVEEEFLLAQSHALVGSHWSKMTKRLPGRTENSIKNFWNATLRSK
jgi:hypothetical protein